MRGAGRSGGRGNHGQDVLYDRKIFFPLKKKKKILDN